MNRTFIRKHITTVAIVIYLAVYGLFIWFKPAFLYNDDGSLRQFGVGYQSKTILPIWFLAMCIGILSYFFVLYYLTAPRLVF
jgi:hypothetical protein